ncbi:MAG: hybrid sensor histidine kinase/response regulator [Myxococcota bacterium]
MFGGLGAVAGGGLGASVTALTMAAAGWATPPGGITALLLNPAVAVGMLAPVAGVAIGAGLGIGWPRRADRPPSATSEAAEPTHPVAEPPEPASPPKGVDPLVSLKATVLELGAQLEEARREVEHHQRSRTALFRAVSHQLFTPLNTVIGYAEIIHEDLERGVTSGLEADIERIARSGRDIHGLLQSLVELSRLEAGHEQAFLEWFDIANELEAVVVALRPAASERGVSLEVRSTIRRSVHVRLDRSRFRSILSILLGAAVRNARESVRLEAHPQPDTQSFAFRVVDDGAPIPASCRDDVFLVFPDVDPASRLYGRASVDLALARRNAMLLGGGLHLEASASGVGFALQVPLDASMHVLSFEGVESTSSLLLYQDEEPTPPLVQREHSRDSRTVSGGPRGSSPLPAPHRPTAVPAGRATDAVVPRPTLIPATGSMAGLSMPPVSPESHSPPAGVPMRGRAILVAEPAARPELGKALADAGWAVTACDDAGAAMHLALARRPDVLVVDGVDSVPDLWDLRRLSRSAVMAGVPLVLAVKGSSETVFVPVADLIGAPVERVELLEALRRLSRGKPGRMLLVENGTAADPSIARTTATRAGWTVVDASAEQARLAENAFDVLVVELHTPGFEGLGTLLSGTAEPGWIRRPLVLVVPRELPDGATARLRGWLDSEQRPRTPTLTVSEAAAVAVAQSHHSWGQ